MLSQTFSPKTHTLKSLKDALFQFNPLNKLMRHLKSRLGRRRHQRINHTSTPSIGCTGSLPGSDRFHRKGVQSNTRRIDFHCPFAFDSEFCLCVFPSNNTRCRCVRTPAYERRRYAQHWIAYLSFFLSLSSKKSLFLC